MKKQLNDALLILTVGLIVVLPSTLSGQDSGHRKERTSEIAFATGMPYAASITYLYAFSEGLCAGFSLAKPNEGLTVGLNVVGDVYQARDVRLFSDAELAYNKSVNSVPFGASWLLISSHFSIERKLGSAMEFSVGTGFVGVLTVNPFPVPVRVPTPITVFGQQQVLDLGTSSGSVALFRFWHSPRIGVTVHVDEKLAIFSDIAFVMNGFVPASAQWSDRTPLFAKAGFVVWF